LEVLASYPDFTFYKAGGYKLKYKNSLPINLENHLGISSEQLDNVISAYGGEKEFIKKFMALPKLINAKNNEIILSNVQEAKTPQTAKTGLLDQNGLLQNEGLLIHNCPAIHMFGMRFPINVYFLDRGFRTVAVFENVPVGTFTPHIRDAFYALETAVVSHNIKVGDQLELVRYSFD
jgi:uncharacterized membrane protein (UPF0127 family)